MSFHDLRETTRISPATTAEQTTSPLMKEFLETAIAGIRSASLRDQSAPGDFRKDGTMLLGLAPLDFGGSVNLGEQVNRIVRGASDSTSPGRSGGGTSYRSGDAPHNRNSEEASGTGDALPGRSTHEQVANAISAAKDALRSKSRESEAANASSIAKTAIEAIGRAILSEVSPTDYGLKSDVEAILPVIDPVNIAPPPRPK